MEETHNKDSIDVSKMTKEFSQRLSQIESQLEQTTMVIFLRNQSKTSAKPINIFSTGTQCNEYGTSVPKRTV